MGKKSSNATGREALERELKQLRKENARLKAEIQKLRNALPQFEPGEATDSYDEFLSAEGVLWKRAPDGTLELTVYCPTCRLVMLPTPSDNPVHFVCTRCHLLAPFGVADLDAAAGRVRARD